MTNTLKRSILWAGEINTDQLKSVVEKLKELFNESPEEEITLLIASQGGELETSLAFYDLVRIVRPNLTTIALGGVHSAAFIVWLAGHHRLVSSHTTMFFHDARRDLKMGAKTWEASDFHGHAELMRICEANFARITERASAGRISPAKLAEMKQARLVLKPKDLFHYKLAHEILRCDD